jgi:hypothetical protein
VKKFIIAASVAMLLGLGSSSKAQAQLVYGYSIPTMGGMETSGMTLTSYGPQSYKDFYSPLTGYMSQTSGSMNTLFSRGSYTTISSPFTGTMTESRGTMMTPFGLASYLSYNSPYTGPVTEARLANSSSANNSNLVNFNQVVPFNQGRWFMTNGNTNGRR